MDVSKPLIGIDLGEVHVRGFILDIGDEELARAAQALSRDEQERADRLVSGQHRRHFMAAHAGLRAVLSRYCGNRPQELVVRKATAGKPFLPDYPSIRFNLTHSHGRALIAVATDREVGVDLEKVRPEVDVIRLAKRFLSGKDQAFIERSEPAQRHERFLQTWVAREAVFKADGSGMAFPLSRDYVELMRDETEGCLVLSDGAPEQRRRFLRFLPLEPGWVGAVAADGTNWTVTYRGSTEF
jgi:4'-phosphopantetheinyl transferase